MKPGMAFCSKGYIRKHSSTRIYLEVPFEEKDIAKEHGCRWDPEATLWFFDNYKPLGDVEQWLFDGFFDLYPFDFSLIDYPSWVKPISEIEDPCKWPAKKFLQNLCDHAHKYPTLKKERIVDYYLRHDEKSKEYLAYYEISEITKQLRRIDRFSALANSQS